MFCSVAGSCGPSARGAAEAAGRSRISGDGLASTSRPDPAMGIASSCSSPTRGSRTNWKPSAMAWRRSMRPSSTESRLSWPSRSWVQPRLRLMPGARQKPWSASPQAFRPALHLPQLPADRFRSTGLTWSAATSSTNSAAAKSGKQPGIVFTSRAWRRWSSRQRKGHQQPAMTPSCWKHRLEPSSK